MEDRNWARCQSMKDCDDYLLDNPNGRHHAEALAILKSLVHESCLKSKSVSSCTKFLKLFPSDGDVTQIRRTLSGLVWPDIRREDTISGYKYYLSIAPADERRYSVAQERILALQRIDTAAWVRATKSGTVEAYEHYLRTQPNGEHVQAAQQSVDTAAWVRATKSGTVEAYEHYLRTQPNGEHGAAAQLFIDAVEARVWEKAAAAQRAVLNPIIEERVRALASVLVPERIPRKSVKLVVVDQGEHGRFVAQIANRAFSGLVTFLDRDGKNTYQLLHEIARLRASEPSTGFVVNMSWSYQGGVEYEVEKKLFQEMRRAGIIFVAAAGNNGEVPTYPAHYPSVISVGAVEEVRTGFPRASASPYQFTEYSNRLEVDFCALDEHGEQVKEVLDAITQQLQQESCQRLLSQRFSNADEIKTALAKYLKRKEEALVEHAGTSFTSPFIAAAIANLMQSQPDIRAEETVKMLTQKAILVGSYPRSCRLLLPPDRPNKMLRWNQGQTLLAALRVLDGSACRELAAWY